MLAVPHEIRMVDRYAIDYGSVTFKCLQKHSKNFKAKNLKHCLRHVLLLKLDGAHK